VAGRFVFVLHPLDLGHYRELEPSLQGADDHEVASFDRLLRDLVEAPEISHVRVRSATGACCEGWFCGIPFTTRGLVTLGRHESRRWLRAAVRLAKARGADIVGLGAFTAVVSGGGLTLKDEGVGITTGNAYTIATATEALGVAARAMGIDEREAVSAVVGANGSIGRVCSIFLAQRARRLLLVGNPNRADALERLQSLATELRSRGSSAEIDCTVDARRAAGEAQLMISTTSAVGPVLRPEWLRAGAVVCDVAQPPDVGSEVRRLRRDVLVIDGGVVRLPEPISLGWSFGFEPGTCFACMAETITLALEGHRGHYSLGARLKPEQALDIAARAARHGFRVAGFRSFGRPVEAAELEAIRRAARR
jgi:predicted amino acid dehydrogenase